MQHEFCCVEVGEHEKKKTKQQPHTLLRLRRQQKDTPPIPSLIKDVEGFLGHWVGLDQCLWRLDRDTSYFLFGGLFFLLVFLVFHVL